MIIFMSALYYDYSLLYENKETKSISFSQKIGFYFYINYFNSNYSQKPKAYLGNYCLITIHYWVKRTLQDSQKIGVSAGLRYLSVSIGNLTICSLYSFLCSMFILSEVKQIRYHLFGGLGFRLGCAIVHTSSSVYVY